MKKEILVAVIFGILLGIAVAIVMIINLRRIETGVATITNPQISPSAQNNSITQLLEVSEPQNASITSKNSTQIKGKASKNALIIIDSPAEQKIFKNEKGSFSLNYPLALGENIISISVYPQDPKLSFQQKTLKVYYLDEQ